MSNILSMKWINELLYTTRDKVVLEILDDMRLLKLIIQRIIMLIKENKMERVLFYITELVYEGYMNTTRMTTIVDIACKYKRYKLLDNIFKNSLIDYNIICFVLEQAYKIDDVNILKTFTKNYKNDFGCIIDMIYTAIAHKAEKIVIYLLRIFGHYSDDIIIACIDMEMYKTFKYILNMGIVDNVDIVFTSLCCVNNISLIKQYIMLFPNVNTMNGLMMASANGFTDIIEFIQSLHRGY